MEKKRVVILGKCCSGKTLLKNALVQLGLPLDVSYTSRKIREINGEKDGVDYHFIEKNDFVNRCNNSFFIQFDLFGGDFYGTSRDEFESKKVFIMTPNGYNRLTLRDRKESIVVYLDIDEAVRLERMSRERKMLPEAILKRNSDDDHEFRGHGIEHLDYDYRQTNPHFDAQNFALILKERLS